MQVFNTLGRRKQELVPHEPGRIGFYVCGPTVQARPHLGHGRSGVVFDVIRRYLVWRGFDVTYVRNVTDVEDKIIAAAAAEGVSTEELAARYEKVFNDAHAALNVEAPDLEPKATDHIPEMIELVSSLIDKGHAYESAGDVYFAVRSFEGYGKLSGRDIDELLSGARVEVDEAKRDPLDFALWKSSKEGEPSWDSPWGPGRPGWHIECSAMAHKYLGSSFDVHGGGNDLIFPHHENEITQSEAATGQSFAKYWLHNGMLNLGGEKMAKSTGHVIDLIEALEEYTPLAVRLFYLRTHYRKPLDFSAEAIADAQASLERLWAFGRRVPGQPEAAPHEPTLEKFRAAMDDDFDTAGGLAVIFDAVREGNRLLDAGEDAGEYLAAVLELLAVLGLSEPGLALDDIAGDIEVVAQRFGASDSGSPAQVITALLDRRAAARDDREWDVADGIRAALADLGIVIEDSADGVRWYRR